MDSFLSFCNEFSDFGLLFGILIFFPFVIYPHFRIKKILGKEFHSVSLTDKSKKRINNIFRIILMIIIIIGLLIFIKYQNPYLFFTFLIIYAEKSLYFKYFISGLSYNDKGFIYSNLYPEKINSCLEPVQWEEVSNINWDNDLGQKNYRFSVNLSKSSKPIKLWINRKYRGKVNDLFQKYGVEIFNS